MAAFQGGLVIRIDDGDTLRQVGVGIDLFGRELSDMRALWGRMEDALEAWQEDAFSTEGGSVGSGWQALSKKYAERKAQTHPGKGILEASGAMRAGLTDAGSQYAFREISGDGLQYVFGTQDLDYPGFHVTGTDDMPRRNPFVPNNELEDAMSRVIQWHGRDAARKAKLKFTARPGDYVEFD